jgi:3-phenylpropionate/trans-cinnamate dioxygenase ferredoxin reductase component
VTAGVVIAGAGLGGLRTAEALRRQGYSGRITLIGDEHHFPYDRPPLTKQVLCGERRTTTFDDRTAALDIELALDCRVGGLDVEARRLLLADEATMPYGTLVIATGADPLVPAGMFSRDGLHTIRTVDQAHRLADALADGADLTIIGGGFIGCEIASSARQLGRAARIIEASSAPLSGALGEQAAALLMRLHVDNGVDVITDARAVAIRGETSVEGVLLDDSRYLTARHVVVALGARPATSWLADSGLRMERGAVVCDEHGRTSAPDVYALGDASSWFHPLMGRHVHVEHWTTTVEQAATVAAVIVGAADPAGGAASVPYFWSDQFGIKIQAIGYLDADADVEVRHPGDHTVVLYGSAGVLRGVVGFGATRTVNRARPLVSSGAPMSVALAALEG